MQLEYTLSIGSDCYNVVTNIIYSDNGQIPGSARCQQSAQR